MHIATIETRLDVRAEEKLTACKELESAIRCRTLSLCLGWRLLFPQFESAAEDRGAQAMLVRFCLTFFLDR
jgi:hypothetical protein